MKRKQRKTLVFQVSRMVDYPRSYTVSFRYRGASGGLTWYPIQPEFCDSGFSRSVGITLKPGTTRVVHAKIIPNRKRVVRRLK